MVLVIFATLVAGMCTYKVLCLKMIFNTKMFILNVIHYLLTRICRLPGDRQTNQRAELFAMMKVLENHLDSDEVLEIRSDSTYCIKVCFRILLIISFLSGLTDHHNYIQACDEWMPAYLRAREPNPKRYQNLDLMLKVHSLIQQRYGMCY